MVGSLAREFWNTKKCAATLCRTGADCLQYYVSAAALHLLRCLVAMIPVSNDSRAPDRLHSRLNATLPGCRRLLDLLSVEQKQKVDATAAQLCAV